jgi:hypothetical protein
LDLLHQKGYINKDNFINKYYAFQRLGGKYRRCGSKKKTFFNVFIKTLAFQMRNSHFGNVLESCVPLWFMLQQDIQHLFNWLFSNFTTLFGWMTKHTWHPFIVSHFKIWFGLKIQDSRHKTVMFISWFLLWYPKHDCTYLLIFSSI